MVSRGVKSPYTIFVRQVPGHTSSVPYVPLTTMHRAGIRDITYETLFDLTFVQILLSFFGELDLVQGIMIELPLPEIMNEKVVCNSVTPEKDVDGFHITNIGRFCLDMNSLAPCTPVGVMELIKRYGIPTFGKNAVVCGRSKNVGMPLAMLLHGDGVRPDGEIGGMDATTTICHRYTPRDQFEHFVASADIIVTATGIPGLITGSMIKPGCAILDVGINRIINPMTGKSKLVGDCDFESCAEVAGWITPVPGGVGPMTVAMLMKSTVQAAKKAIAF
ncbi:unnamed protein product, partial [Meganyctiphanes norvegica]